MLESLAGAGATENAVSVAERFYSAVTRVGDVLGDPGRAIPKHNYAIGDRWNAADLPYITLFLNFAHGRGLAQPEVDAVLTGMGFERVTSILQCTREFSDFGGVISNYETDVFRPIFDALERLSGRRYGSTLPASNLAGLTEPQTHDIAFRVIADHIRTLGFAIADGILPGNTDRNYVLRRILRRAVRYGRSLVMAS